MNNRLEQLLVDALGPQNVLRDEPMGAHTTFHVGGPADFFVTPGSEEEVERTVAVCRESGASLFVIGCGSNVLVADAGLRGVVMKIGPRLSAVEVRDGGSVIAQAGATNAKVARVACEAGLSGFEFAAGIPGSVGGAAIMNAGAYGGEFKDVATDVVCLAPHGETVSFGAEEADWGYRRSRMYDEGHVVLSVGLRFVPGDPVVIRERIAELARRRSDSQPLDMPSAGSTFKRPEGHFAGKLVQDAGMQGHAVGGAQVSVKHAGFVVNAGGANAADIMQVIEDVRDAVFARFGVELEPEVRCWGF